MGVPRTVIACPSFEDLRMTFEDLRMTFWRAVLIVTLVVVSWGDAVCVLNGEHPARIFGCEHADIVERFELVG